jgi:adenylate cyclase
MPDELRSALLGGPLRYTRSDVAEASGVPMREVAAMWRAMGFPDVGEARAFTDADLAALLRVQSLRERGLLDGDSALELTRSLGHTTARLAEWQVDTIGRRWAARLSAEAGPGMSEDALDRARAVTAELLPELEALLGYVWRRQVAATLARAFADFDDAAEESAEATVGFADLVSFTRLSRQLDEDALALLVQSFESAASDVVHAAGGRLVKTLGDEVMFVAEEAAVAAEIGLRLHDLSRNDPELLPPLRTGLATGPVLTRMGDVFGTTVNRASRLTASARPGTTVVDAATAEALTAAADDRFSVRAMAPRPVRGLGIMRPYSLGHGQVRMPPGRRPPRAQAEADSDTGAGSSSSGSAGAGNTNLR